MSEPTVSVVVASYNYGRYLRQALDSIRAQTVSDWECIVVDDGSTDDSLPIAESYLPDRRFRLIRQHHEGQPRTKNAGLRASRGKFVAFLDADDAWHPEKLVRQLALFAQRPDVGACGTGRQLMDGDGKLGPVFPMKRVAFAVGDFFHDNPICFSSAMVRRVVWEHLGGFDESVGIAIDFDYWLRVSRHYAIAGVADPLVLYREGHANLSSRVLERLHVAGLLMRRFRQHYDRPAKLDARSARRALVTTAVNRGLVERTVQPAAALGTMLTAVRLAPGDPASWVGLGRALVPAWLRPALRALAGKPQWEGRVTHANNRPEQLV